MFEPEIKLLKKIIPKTLTFPLSQLCLELCKNLGNGLLQVVTQPTREGAILDKTKLKTTNKENTSYT